MKPGQKFIHTQNDGLYLIVLLSSDPEPGMHKSLKSLWRCAQFMVLSTSDWSWSLCGAQIVLYTEAELKQFKRAGRVGHIVHTRI